MVKSASFVVESFPPGYMNGLGFRSHQSVSGCPPRIVTSITPFGQDGPYKDYKSSDIVSVAMSGLMYMCGDADRAPLRFSAEQAYCHAGLQAAVGTLIAFYYQLCSGKGQHVDVSVQESVLRATMVEQHFWDLNKIIQKREERRPLRKHLDTSDIPMKGWFCCLANICGSGSKEDTSLGRVDGRRRNGRY